MFLEHLKRRKAKNVLSKGWRFVYNVIQTTPNPHINVSLGIRGDKLKDYEPQFHSTSCYSFYRKGFLEVEDVMANQVPFNTWMPLLQAMYKAYKAGGEIYFHLDGLDLTALYTKMHGHFNGGTLTELRFLIEKKLFQKPDGTNFVEFKMNGNNLTLAKQLELDDAIAEWKNKVASKDIYTNFSRLFKFWTPLSNYGW